MAFKTIPLSSVRIGMYLCGIDRSWLDTPFLRHRFLIRSDNDISKLQSCGVREITIDTDRGLDVQTASEHTEAIPPPTEEPALKPQTPPTPASPSVAIKRIQELPTAVRGKSLAGELTSTKLTQQAMLESVKDILHTKRSIF